MITTKAVKIVTNLVAIDVLFSASIDTRATKDTDTNNIATRIIRDIKNPLKENIFFVKKFDITKQSMSVAIAPLEVESTANNKKTNITTGDIFPDFELSKHISCDILGFDIIQDLTDGKYYVMEINISPHMATFCVVSGINLPEVITNYIVQEINV